MSKKQIDPIPDNFESYEAAGEFWDTHDLAQQRQENRISPERWWWHLDVLAELPAGAVVSMMEPVAAD